MKYDVAKKIIFEFRKGDLRPGDVIPKGFISIQHNNHFDELNLKLDISEMVTDGLLIDSDLGYILTKRFFE
jgi:hypothetical protein